MDGCVRCGTHRRTDAVSQVLPEGKSSVGSGGAFVDVMQPFNTGLRAWLRLGCLSSERATRRSSLYYHPTSSACPEAATEENCFVTDHNVTQPLEFHASTGTRENDLPTRPCGGSSAGRSGGMNDWTDQLPAEGVRQAMRNEAICGPAWIGARLVKLMLMDELA
jgi:hypothetical protein